MKLGWQDSIKRLTFLGLTTTSLLAVICHQSANADDSVQLLGSTEFPGTATDKSGLDNMLDHSVPHNRLGGLSAIEYSGANDLYYVLSDRGPGDGSARFTCRFHTIELKVPQGSGGAVTARLVGTTLLTAADGKPYIGIASAFDPHGPDGNHRLDPEAIRRGPTGSLFISDEYGPYVIEFDSSGHELRSLKVPARYRIAHTAATKEEEIARNTSGRISNAGFE